MEMVTTIMAMAVLMAMGVTIVLVLEVRFLLSAMAADLAMEWGWATAAFTECMAALT